MNYFYKIKHISLIEIKTHILTEYFYPYFFTFRADKDYVAWNDSKTQIKNYNIIRRIYTLDAKNKYLVNNIVKLTFIKFHEYCHTKFKGNYKLYISPRYLLLENLNYLDNKKIFKDESRIKDKEIIEFIGESGQAIERYIFGDKKIVNNIIYSKMSDLSQLYNSELFIQNNFDKLNELVERFKTDFNQKKSNEENQQTRLGNEISIPKLNIKKDGKVKIYTYYDLGISSTDLLE